MFKFGLVMAVIVLLGAGGAAVAQPLQNQETPPPVAEKKAGSSFIAQDSDISGEEEYVRYCSVCHGLDAKGGGALAKSLKKTPADLTQIAKRNGGHFPFSQVARTIRDGGGIASHGNEDMPAWGEVFRDHVDAIMARALIFELTLYLESLQE